MFTRSTGRVFPAAVLIAFSVLACGRFVLAQGKGLTLPEALARVKIFSGLTQAERESLQPAASLRHGRAGERIIEQGKAARKMFIILNGKAEVLVNGKRIVTLSGESLVGEIEFLDALPASADVVLVEEADMVELNNDGLKAILDKQPRMGYVLMSQIAKIAGGRLRETDALSK